MKVTRAAAKRRFEEVACQSPDKGRVHRGDQVPARDGPWFTGNIPLVGVPVRARVVTETVTMAMGVVRHHPQVPDRAVRCVDGERSGTRFVLERWMLRPNRARLVKRSN